MKPIMLATDGSPSAAVATDEAITLAKALGTYLVAVAVEHVSVPAYGYYGYTEVLAELTEAEHQHVAEVLAQVEGLATYAGLECETMKLKGPVVDSICKAAREVNATMIVIGAHGWGPLRRLVFGSVSTGVLHEAPCPVLVARGEHAEHAPRDTVHADATAV
jgi:nucleotide-binding universal stress UspA family protein